MPISLPTGTLTFFFSDIEGSTRLVQRLGPEFTGVLDDHHEIVRSAMTEADATEVRTVGDAFFVVFRSATEAIEASTRIQKDLDGHPWPDQAPVRVRIGLHTGEGRLGGDDYVGVDVHRAARIGDAGHGGQVLTSSTTRALATSDGASFADLGEHLLKDIERPEHIFQVVVPGLPVEFPPLRTRNARANNLPARATSLIGRSHEIAEVSRLLGEHRLVTLLGPGGVGKTRLAIAAAGEALDRFRDGVTFVDLSPVQDPEHVAGSIAGALGAADASLDRAIDALQGRELLLVIDNFEQVLPAAADLATLIQRCPGVSALVTSQAPLSIDGEHRYGVGPFSSGAGADPRAMELFMARAKAIDPAFAGDPDLVAAIVAALDGLPLAVELAAAQVHVLPLDDILQRLDAGRMPAAVGAQQPERHRSLENVLMRSYDLLEPAHQATLRRLGVFVGGMTVPAAEEVAAGDPVGDAFAAVTALVDRSLLRRRTDGSGRFDMLDGVRRFAMERLDDAGERQPAEGAHADWFCTLTDQADVGLQSDRGEWWRARLDAELDNLRAALERMLIAGDAERGLSVLGDTWRYMQSRGHLRELDAWLDRFFALPEAATAGVGRAKGLMARAALHYWRSDPQPAIDDYAAAVELARTLGADATLAEALYGLATSMIVAHRPEEAGRLLAECDAIHARLGNDQGRADVLAAQLFLRIRTDGIVGLGPGFEQDVEYNRNAGRMVNVAQGLYALTGVAIAEGRPEDARATALEGLDVAEASVDDWLIAWGLEWLAIAEIDLGEMESAALLVGAGSRAREAHGGGWSPEVVGLADATTRLVEILGEDEAQRMIAAGRDLSLVEGLAVARRAR